MMMKPLRGVGVALVLAAAPAWAVLPDPVTLGVAVEVGNIDAARRWLDEGLDPNSEADRVGSGLMIAAWEGNVPMMELFLTHGADIHKTNRHNEQALQLAAWRGHVGAVRWLLDHGASVSRDGKAWSALHYAVFAGHGEIANLLMARGADVNARAPNDATVLMMAAREGREELAKNLVDAGADPRLTNDRGDTALTWAMRNGNFRIAKMVTTTEIFAQAVKAPPESFGPAKKSVPAPSEITELLRQLREAEANGQPTEALRAALMTAIERFRTASTPLNAGANKRTASDPRPTLLITASRKSGDERAEVVAATPARMSWDYEESGLNELTEAMRQLDDAEKAGRPTAQLRRTVQEAYQRMKGSR
ncbi:MAG TPA: ankyrin repeat domain-containing protein [Rhodocyclaceae bacterium]|nr:ankyrin repeat domain-containing protein [Rhodocyclaceae bacterium]